MGYSGAIVLHCISGLRMCGSIHLKRCIEIHVLSQLFHITEHIHETVLENDTIVVMKNDQSCPCLKFRDEQDQIG